MSLVQVVRSLPSQNWPDDKQVILKRGYLDMRGTQVSLSGPGHGGNIEGILLETHGSYTGANYDIRLVVLAEWGTWYRELFQKECLIE